jgi:hypothetical protein
MVAALRATEENAAASLEQHERALTDFEVATLLDDAVTFAQAGKSALIRRRATVGARRVAPCASRTSC